MFLYVFLYRNIVSAELTRLICKQKKDLGYEPKVLFIT